MPNNKTIARAERGFSLIELLMAMVITLIVTGSIYGLLAQGQNAFRREPEISDRQQQIRLAMDLIQRDITTAGMAMPEWAQTFTPGLDAVGPPNAQGIASDYLEMMGYDGACTPVPLCAVLPGPTAAALDTAETLPACYTFPRFVLVRPGLDVLGAPLAASVAVATLTAGPGSGACAADLGETLTLSPAMPVVPPLAPPRNWNIQSDGAVSGAAPPAVGDIRPVQIVRYQIFVDPGNGVPSLWRSTQGGMDTGLNAVAPGGAGADWQLVATGIEDLQVQYRDGSGAWSDPALPVDRTLAPPANWATVVREVKVTLSARTTGQQILQGESVSVTGVRAIRGQLTSVTAPRAALYALSWVNVPAAQQWN